MNALELAECFELSAVDHKPEGWPAIQQDTLNKAAAMLRKQHDAIKTLRDAVLAEREECAMVAESGFKYALSGYEIADKIRAQGAASPPPPAEPAVGPLAHINSNGVVHAAGYPWEAGEVLTPLFPPPAEPAVEPVRPNLSADDRAARIAAQIENEALKARLAASGVAERRAVRDAVLAEREACAMVAESGFKYALSGYEIADKIRAQGAA